MATSPPIRLDEIDHLLLDLLQQDADRKLHELGEAVGLSLSAVQRRLARYRASGVISRQIAVLDPDRTGSTVLATVLVTLAHETAAKHRSFADRMRATPEVQQCYQVAGAWDYVVIMAATSMKHCSELGHRLFKEDDNIQRYETLLTFDTIKTGLAIPLKPSEEPG